jgi:hypothetical protein
MGALECQVRRRFGAGSRLTRIDRNNAENLPPRQKKSPHYVGRFAFPNAPINIGRVVAGRLREKPGTMIDRAAFGIARGKVEPAHTGEGNRGGAHRAGLERHVKVAAGQPLRSKFGAGQTNRQDFRMRRRVETPKSLVAGARENFPIAHDNGSDRHLLTIKSRPRFKKCAGHWIAFL